MRGERDLTLDTADAILGTLCFDVNLSRSKNLKRVFASLRRYEEYARAETRERRAEAARLARTKKANIGQRKRRRIRGAEAWAQLGVKSDEDLAAELGIKSDEDLAAELGIKSEDEVADLKKELRIRRPKKTG
jgi:hypothetical protein